MGAAVGIVCTFILCHRYQVVRINDSNAIKVDSITGKTWEMYGGKWTEVSE